MSTNPQMVLDGIQQIEIQYQCGNLGYAFDSGFQSQVPRYSSTLLSGLRDDDSDKATAVNSWVLCVTSFGKWTPVLDTVFHKGKAWTVLTDEAGDPIVWADASLILPSSGKEP